jgi:hypothetical protein
MSVTDWKTPGTCASVDRDGKPEWSNPDNAKTSNDSYATALPPKNDYTDWLRVTNFGFSTADIPSGATINGIEAKIERKYTASESLTVYDSAVYLRKTSGQVGDNKGSGVLWTTSDVEAVYGGAADTWNAGLIDTDIKSSNFGLDFSAYFFGIGTPTAYVDCISIRVYYTAGGTVYTKSIVAKTGTLLGKSRVITAVRSKVSLSGSAIPAKSRVVTVVRSKAALAGTNILNTRALTIARLKTTLAGTTVAQNIRVLTIARAKVAPAGTNTVNTRALTVMRLKTVPGGTAIGMSRALIVSRAKTILAGTKTLPSRVLTIGRKVVAPAGTLVNATVQFITVHVYGFAIVIHSGTLPIVNRVLTLARHITARSGTLVHIQRLGKALRMWLFSRAHLDISIETKPPLNMSIEAKQHRDISVETREVKE